MAKRKKKAASKKQVVKKVVTKKAAAKKVKTKKPVEVKLPTEQKDEWVALFTHSGSEIVELVKELGYWPGTIITNNNKKEDWDPELVKREEAVKDRKKKTIHIVNVTQSKTANFIHRYARFDDSQVTLHGWSKTIPTAIKKDYNIVEGKPVFDVKEPKVEEVVKEEVVEVKKVVDEATVQLLMDAAEERIDIIGKNGNDGEHYDAVQPAQPTPPKFSPIGVRPKVAKQWVTLFSQSGSEIANLAERLDFWPDKIITSNSDKETWDPRIVERSESGEHTDKFKVIVVNEAQAGTANFLHGLVHKDALITLHGWLRIIPADICNQYKIVNGHPGLITTYPDLKGKDPQARWWANRDKYDRWYGSVVHDVVPEVDAGQVHAVNKRQLTKYEEQDCDPFELFRETSLNSWIKYFIKFPIK